MESSNGAFCAGVDIGAVGAKAVILAGGKIVGSAVVPTAVNAEKSGMSALETALKMAGISRSDLKQVVATGYGRRTIPFADKTVTEIGCHARGAFSLNTKVRTLIDMGGQDCKAIRIDDQGRVTEFIMNDKCASGTGRFLEVMSRVFEIPVSEMGPLALKAEKVVPMSSTCTVFAESEVISLMARGEKPEDIINGVHHAIGQRVAGLLTRVGIEDELFFSGGVAKNVGMIRALEEIIGKTVVTSHENPQLMGALGAALFAVGRIAQ